MLSLPYKGRSAASAFVTSTVVSPFLGHVFDPEGSLKRARCQINLSIRRATVDAKHVSDSN